MRAWVTWVLGAIRVDVVKFPWLTCQGHQLPLTITDRPVVFVIEVDRLIANQWHPGKCRQQTDSFNRIDRMAIVRSGILS